MAENKYMEYYKAFTPEEAQAQKSKIRADAELELFIAQALKDVAGGKEVFIPAHFPVKDKSLKVSIRKMAKEKISVRFDKAIGGGFFIREADEKEKTRGKEAGARLGQTRRRR
jgi:hypothetical protein